MRKFFKNLTAKPKIFFRTLTRSVSDPAYYKDIIAAKFSFSFKYLTALTFFISLIFGIVFGIKILGFIPKVPQSLAGAKSFLMAVYPRELKIAVKNKKIVTNVKEPYYIAFPEGRDFMQGKFKNFLTIDTAGKVEDFNKHETWLFVTADNLAVSDDNGGYSVKPLAEFLGEFPDGVYLDQNGFAAFLTSLEPQAGKILPRFFIFVAALSMTVWPLVRTGLYLLFKMLILLPIALVVLFVSFLMKRNLSWVKIYQMELHAVTIPLIFSFAFIGGKLNLLFSIVGWFGFGLILLLALKKMPRK